MSTYTRQAQRALARANIAGRQVLSSTVRVASSSVLSARSVASPSVWRASGVSAFHSSSARSAAPTPQSAAPGSVIDFNLADIGEGIAECEVLRWFIKEGDTIAQFDKVCEVQSDKANVEITSRYDGKVLSLAYSVGDLAKVGKPLLQIQLAANAESPIDTHQADTQEPHTEIASHVSLVQQLVQGDGQGARYLHSEHEHAALHAANAKVLTSPAVRRIAKEEHVPLAQVKGTGPAGRILKEDVMNYIKNGRKASASSVAAAPAAAPAKAAAAPAAACAAAAPAAAAQPAKTFAAPSQYLAEDKVFPVTGVNRIMVQTMNAANAVPQLGFGDEINVDALWEMRAMLNKEAQSKYGVKLSFMPFILKAASLALKQFPQLNAHANADCSQVTHKASHNLGLAMDTPRGLLVPNIKDVANKSVLDIAVDMARLARLGQEGKLGREELTGGTFTISNVGSIGGTYMKPLLVVPEVVIGALGSFQTLPRYDAAMQLRPTRVMNVSWSADHRVVDGATMARFSNLWKYYLENPAAMLLDTK